MNEHRKLPRRRHSAQFKREVLAACNELGASVAGVALAFGLNANLVRQWRRGRMAMIFQEPATSLNPVLTVGRQISEVLERHLDPNGAPVATTTAELQFRANGMASQTQFNVCSDGNRSTPYQIAVTSTGRIYVEEKSSANC